jgi:hypothetical protein
MTTITKSRTLIAFNPPPLPPGWEFDVASEVQRDLIGAFIGQDNRSFPRKSIFWL